MRLNISLVLCLYLLPISNGSFAATNPANKLTATSSKANDQITLTIDVKRIRSSHGKIMALLFDQKDGFPSDAVSAHSKGKATINNLSSQIVFQHLQPGNYAIALFHDENDDSKLNKHWYGKPMEGVATSNNIVHHFSAPSYEECRFTLDRDMKVEVQLHYFD